MERLIITLVGLASWAVSASADEVRLLPPPPQEELTPIEYPQSRFGYTPEAPRGREIRREPAGVRGEIVGQDGGSRTIKTQDVEVGQKPLAELVPDKSKGIQEVSVIAADMGFFPKTFFVTRDIPVRLFVTGASKATLCIMMDSFNVKKQVRTQRIEEITFVPNTPGTFRFYCPVNGMEGTMVVKELASAGF